MTTDSMNRMTANGYAGRRARRKACAPLAVAWLAAALLATPVAALAQAGSAYPSKAVRIIVPLAPGGAVSVVARIYAEGLTRAMGQTFYVDHRSGAETLIGTQAAATATADGYHLLVVSPAFAVNHTLFPKRGYDTLKDFEPIAGLAQTSWVLVTNPQVPGSSLKTFVAEARKKPGGITMASASSIGVLMNHQLETATGAKYTLIPYKGQGQITTDLVAGVVQATLTTATNVEQHLKSGALRALATAGESRDPLFPQLPTFAEQGFPGFVASSRYTLLAPKGTPSAVVDKLNAAVSKLQQDPKMRQALGKLGFALYATSLADVRLHVAQDVERYGALVTQSGLLLTRP